MVKPGREKKGIIHALREESVLKKMDLMRKSEANEANEANEATGGIKLRTMSQYIFNPDEVLQLRPFVFQKFNNICAVGILLPKEREILTKKGAVIGKEQINAPVLITSEGELLECTKSLEKERKLKFESIPSELPLRWSLPSIKRFLLGDYEQIDGMKLFMKIKGKYEEFLYFHNEKWYTIHALWDIATYFFLLFKVFPIVELRGMKDTAKSKIMTVSSCMTFNATGIMTDPSESTLFRETHEKRPTKYIDEAESLFRIEKGKVIPDQRIEVINSSYSYQGSVCRVEKFGNKFQTVYYHTYSPTVVGSINGLYGATESRAILHVTTKAPKDDPRGEKEPDVEDKAWQEIRDELYVYLLQNIKEIDHIYQTLRNDSELRTRDYQLWRPLLVVAKHLSEELYNETKEFAEAICKVGKVGDQIEGTIDFHLLRIFWDLIKEGNAFVLISDIRKRYPSADMKPAYKTIGSRLDKLGFFEFKEHTSKGNGYLVSGDVFQSIILPSYPNILSSFSLYYSSYSSYSSYTDEKVNEENEKCMKNMKNPFEKTETNEAHSVEEVCNKQQNAIVHEELVISITDLIRTNDNGVGVSIEVLKNLTGWDDKPIEEELKMLSTQGVVFENKSGFWKVLE